MLTIKETVSDKYPPRIYHNAGIADLTIAFAVDFSTAGEQLTKKATIASRPGPTRYLPILIHSQLQINDCMNEICQILSDIQVRILNIAGNSLPILQKHGISQDQMDKFITKIIRTVYSKHYLSEIVTGGQTGVDLAGARAGYACGIPVTVTMPKGFLQRNEQGVDITNTEADIRSMITK
jgi:hypothetical protein